METRNLIILGIWIFVALVWIGYLWIGQVMEFLGVIILFFIAIVFSVAVAVMLPPSKK